MAFLSTIFIVFKKVNSLWYFIPFGNDVFISTVDLEPSELKEIGWTFRKVVGFISSSYHTGISFIKRKAG